uniref:Zgc:113425 n=1 Tax=Amphiprion percula TaxID=161767 RepID=A0A3P8S5Z6_AMPPE
MDRYRYFIFNQRSVLVLGILQVVCAGLCVVCGFMDAVFRKDTPLSSTRTPVWGGLVRASRNSLVSQDSNFIHVMVAAAGLSCVAVLFLSGYSCLTLTYGEEDEEVFHHHDSPEVTFVLHRMVKGANATILLSCSISLVLSALIGWVGCRSLPRCGCYDARTGLVGTTTHQTSSLCPAGGDDRLFNSPAASSSRNTTEEEEGPSSLASYSRLT